MDPAFWHERWALGEIGFHRRDIHWALTQHWNDLRISAPEPILVPLCGKSHDMHWLANEGHSVVGVELDRRAIESFFTEQPSPEPPAVSVHGAQTHHTLPPYLLVEADFFKLEHVGPFNAFYDRAALIAMPPAMRSAYLDQLRSLLTDQAKGLLITYEYEQNQMDGPPFSVTFDEINRHGGFLVEPLERRDVLSEHKGMQAKGLSKLTECVYLMTAH